MKNFKHIYTLLVMALVGLSLAACSNDDLDTNQYKGGVSLNAYGPNPVMRGGTLRFVGSNLDQVASIQIPGVPAITNYDVVKSGVPSEIRVEVPKDGPTEGYVTLTSKTNETIQTLSELTYTEPIEFESFSPEAAMPGDIVTIKGDYLNLIYSLAFADKVIIGENEFLKHDRYTIEVRVPEEAKTGKIELYTADLTVSSAEELDYQIIPSEKAIEIGTPTVTSIIGRNTAEALGNITAKAGEEIKITGSYFNMVDDVLISGVSADDLMMAEDGSALKFTLPEESPDGDIIIVCKSGVEVPVGTLTTVKPTNCVATPNPVKAGQPLTINGNDMDLVVDIVFADFTGEFVLSNNQNIINTKDAYAVTVPEEATEGTLKLMMANSQLIDVAFTLVKPTVTGYDVNPVSAGSQLEVTGTDLDLVKYVTFGDAANDDDKFAYSDDGKTIIVTVPMAGTSGKPQFYLGNGTFVEGPELSINEAVFCYITDKIWETQEIELVAGGDMKVPVANGDKLTGVQIKGTDCQYVLVNGKTELIIGIPDNAGKDSELKLISSNGEISYIVDFTPNTEVTTVLWTGAVDLGSWSLNWQIGDGSFGADNPNMFKDMDLQVGDVIRVYITPYNDWWNCKIYNGHWAEQPEAGVAAGIGATCEINPSNYNPEEHGGCIEFTATPELVEQLTTLTDWGYCWIWMGEGVVITKIAVTHYISAETTVWEGEAVADNWGNQPYILSDGGTELLAAGMKVGSLIRVYITATDAAWNCQLVDGHWNPNTPFPGCDYNNGNWDLSAHNGALELLVTDYVYEHITSSQGWGGSFLLNGDNVICTKVTIE
ncbi:MAG: hypothetical protein IJQ49_05920 [Prevotella sp.]|nr:hypothetical protein [Prevotella sp.]